MARGKQGHAPCRTSRSKNSNGSQLLRAPIVQRLRRAAPVYHKMEGATHILECESIACSMMVDRMGALRCRFGCGI